jgi:hypothetical protein
MIPAATGEPQRQKSVIRETLEQIFVGKKRHNRPEMSLRNIVWHNEFGPSYKLEQT